MYMYAVGPLPVQVFFFSSRRRHTRSTRDWSSDVCSSDLPARHDDGGHDAADLARHRDGDQVGDEDRGAELLQLDGADEGQDEPDEKADQTDDAQRARAALLNDEEEIGHAKPCAAAHQGTERDQALAEE